jgi:hypothetical protein
MANMILDSYTFPKQPGEMTMIEKEKMASSLLTYTSVAYFSWGASIIGKMIKLRWGGMTTAQFNTLQTKFEADAEVVFDPQDGGGVTYNVEIMGLTGKYHLSLLDSAAFRTDVEMTLLIISEV